MNQQPDTSLQDRESEASDALPAPGQLVWVQCKGFRTMAYRDQNGAWRTVARGQELQGPIKVLKD